MTPPVLRPRSRHISWVLVALLCSTTAAGAPPVSSTARPQQVRARDTEALQHACRCDQAVEDAQRFVQGFLPPDVRIPFRHNAVAFDVGQRDAEGSRTSMPPPKGLSPVDKALAALLATAQAHPDQPLQVHLFASASAAQLGADDVNTPLSSARAGVVWQRLVQHPLYQRHLSTRTIHFSVTALGAQVAGPNVRPKHDLSVDDARRLERDEAHHRWVLVRVVPEHLSRLGDQLPQLPVPHRILQTTSTTSPAFAAAFQRCALGPPSSSCFDGHRFSGGPRCYVDDNGPAAASPCCRGTCRLRPLTHYPMGVDDENRPPASHASILAFQQKLLDDPSLQTWLPSRTCCCRGGRTADCGPRAQTPPPPFVDDGQGIGLRVRIVDDAAGPQVHPGDIGVARAFAQRWMQRHPQLWLAASTRGGRNAGAPRPPHDDVDARLAALASALGTPASSTTHITSALDAFDPPPCGAHDFACHAVSKDVYVFTSPPTTSSAPMPAQQLSASSTTSPQAALLTDALAACGAQQAAWPAQHTSSRPVDGLDLEVRHANRVHSAALQRLVCRFVERNQRIHAPWRLLFSVEGDHAGDAQTFRLLAWRSQLRRHQERWVQPNRLLASAVVDVGAPPPHTARALEFCARPVAQASTSSPEERSEFCTPARLLPDGRASAVVDVSDDDKGLWALSWRWRLRRWLVADGGFSPWESLLPAASWCAQATSGGWATASCPSPSSPATVVDDRRLQAWSSVWSRQRTRLHDRLLTRARTPGASMPEWLFASVVVDKTAAGAAAKQQLLHAEATGFGGFARWQTRLPARASASFLRDATSPVALLASDAEHQGAGHPGCFVDLPPLPSDAVEVEGCVDDRPLRVALRSPQGLTVQLGQDATEQWGAGTGDTGAVATVLQQALRRVASSVTIVDDNGTAPVVHLSRAPAPDGDIVGHFPSTTSRATVDEAHVQRGAAAVLLRPTQTSPTQVVFDARLTPQQQVELWRHLSLEERARACRAPALQPWQRRLLAPAAMVAIDDVALALPEGTTAVVRTSPAPPWTVVARGLDTCQQRKLRAALLDVNLHARARSLLAEAGLSAFVEGPSAALPTTADDKGPAVPTLPPCALPFADEPQ